MLQIKFNQKRHDRWIANKNASKRKADSGIFSPLFVMFYRKYRTVGNDHINAVNKALEVIRGKK